MLSVYSIVKPSSANLISPTPKVTPHDGRFPILFVKDVYLRCIWRHTQQP